MVGRRPARPAGGATARAEPSVATVDAVVVGSGFGGSVAALRLAEAGSQVVLLERGKPYPAGSFPRRPNEMATNLWQPRAGLHGLFDIWSFRHLEAVVASGLGGGSLIYASVLLRKDERWFVQDQGPGGGYESWPVTRAQLDPYYDRVEEMLGAADNPYPYVESTPKSAALRDAAVALGLDWRPVPLAVTFAAPGRRPGDPIPGAADNLHGVNRLSCRLCGECDLGCNDGAKNTLDYTYLSRAARHQADLRTRCEVREIRLLGGGFEVAYVNYGEEHDGEPTDPGTLPRRRIRCRVLVLAAGALGTSSLLLRNQAEFPALGTLLGTRFCGNGDLLGFVRGSRRQLQPSRGPVITGAIRVPDAVDGGVGRGFYLQDGGYPGFVDWLVENGMVLGPARRLARFAVARLGQRLTRSERTQISTEVAALLGPGTASGNTMPLLGMGRDVPDGRLRLAGDNLDVDWCDTTSVPYFSRLQATMAMVAGTVGGRFEINPSRYLGRVITAHPLGGVPMGADPRRGVVDDHGEAFGHPGLFVVDGSVLPGPVGPNPALTIAALAERSTERILDRLATANVGVNA